MARQWAETIQAPPPAVAKLRELKQGLKRSTFSNVTMGELASIGIDLLEKAIRERRLAGLLAQRISEPVRESKLPRYARKSATRGRANNLVGSANGK